MTPNTTDSVPPQATSRPLLAEQRQLFEDAWQSGDRALTRARVVDLIADAQVSAECLLAGEFAERLGERMLQDAAFKRAAALDRNNQTALTCLAVLARDQGDSVSTFVMIEEAARVGPLPPSVEALRQSLYEEVRADARIRPYLRAIGRIPAAQAFFPKKVLVVTNLFPPQEFGGYGRMMWEFANGLRVRGHDVRVLSSDSAAYGKAPTEDEVAMESSVSRALELCGEWHGLRSVLLPRDEVRRRDRANVERVTAELKTFQPDLVLAGNLDFLGQNVIQAALNASVPVLHALANARPGYGQTHQPTSPLYWVAPCSDWNRLTFRDDGYHPARMDTLYPGARIDRFFRFMLPDNARLRICYASLVAPYKGADTLVNALVQLNRSGVDFTAEIAGEAPDAGFLAEMTDLVRAAGLEERVRFTGFLDRNELGALFARNNVLVFPSQFPEPFGISQVEALASGMVVVTSATGGAKEIVQDGIDGIHFEAGNADDLAEKIRSLSANPLTMTALQLAGQAQSVQFSVDNAVAKIEELMESLIGQAGATPVASHAVG